MRFPEKLHKQMQQRGLNQQRLARLSNVSDSEVSRILAGKSLPGLENAFRLSRAVGVSLDYLADDALDSDPAHGPDSLSDAEQELIRLGREIGFANAQTILNVARLLGAEYALRRLIDARPLIEANDAGAKQRPAAAPVPATAAGGVGFSQTG